MTRGEVVGLARAWLGTPYVLGGDVMGPHGGTDCVGLIRAVWRDVTGGPTPRVPPWRADWSAAQQGFALLSAARTYLVPAALPGAPGDVVIFRVGLRPAHTGILSAPGWIIHAVEGAGVVEVSLGAMAANVVGAFSFPGVSD